MKPVDPSKAVQMVKKLIREERPFSIVPHEDVAEEMPVTDHHAIRQRAISRRMGPMKRGR